MASVFSIVSKREKLFSITFCFFCVTLIRAGIYPFNVCIRLGTIVVKE